MGRSVVGGDVGSIESVVAGTVPVGGRAVGHVDYVTPEGAAGEFAALARALLSSPGALLLLAAGAVAAVGAAAAYLRFASAVPDVAVARRTLSSYRPYLPWMLRLAVGLPLVGAGFAGYLFSPAVAVPARLLQVGLGFLLLFGLATRLVAAAGLVVYLAALTRHFPTLLLSSEYVAGFLGILLLGPGQPSADMLLRRLVVTDGTVASRARGLATPRDALARLGLGPEQAPVAIRVFLGLNFVYLGIAEKWLQPERAAAVVAKYDLTAVVPVSPELWVFGAGLTEAVVGLLLVAGAFTRGVAGVGFLLLTTTLFGLPDDPVLAHVTLFGLTSALLVTGGGRYALDASYLPSLRRRLDPGARAEADGEADPAAAD